MNNEIRPKLRVFVEGQTEKNYFDELGKDLNINFYIEPIDMNGGGYHNFLLQVKKKGYLGCTAIFIIVDLDKLNDSGEKANFNKLLEFCRVQNKNRNILPPYFLIGTRNDFEYFACSHSEDYKNTNTDLYITKVFKYKSVKDFKSDPRIYYFLNSNKRSYNIACDKLKKRAAYINNTPKVVKRNNGDIIITNKKITIDENVESVRNSNMYELFNIIKGAC